MGPRPRKNVLCGQCIRGPPSGASLERPLDALVSDYFPRRHRNGLLGIFNIFYVNVHWELRHFAFQTPSPPREMSGAPLCKHREPPSLQDYPMYLPVRDCEVLLGQDKAPTLSADLAGVN